MPVTPNQSQIQQVLVSFLAGILPTGIPIVEGQDNRVVEPLGPDFLVFWTINRQRLETNVDIGQDSYFTASIAGNAMTVYNTMLGFIKVGAPVFGAGIAAGTTVTALGSGTGGVGTYTVSPPQSISAEPMAAGTTTLTQNTQLTIQIDVHGPNSADNAQIISTAFRDDYAVNIFYALNPAVSPLYADDPRQTPFMNAEQQYETRYVIDALIQANQSIIVPQQYASVINITTVEVDLYL